MGERERARERVRARAQRSASSPPVSLRILLSEIAHERARERVATGKHVTSREKR